MKIALISDIHGNLPALEAVIAHAGELKVKKIWNLGDFTGFGANPDEVVKLMNKLKTNSIIGNYDQKVLKVPRKSEDWKDKKVPEKWFSFHWTYGQLSKKSIDYLSSLPETRKEVVKDWKILLTHGSPESIDEALTDETPQERLRDLAKKAHANIIICGHSHQSFMRFADGSIFVNPGSVGRPFDGDPRASYAIVSIKKRKFEVDFYRIEYDVDRAARNQLSAGLPSIYAEMTRKGLSLDDLKQEEMVISQETPVEEPESSLETVAETPPASDKTVKRSSRKKTVVEITEAEVPPDQSVEVTRETIQSEEPENGMKTRKRTKAGEK